MWSVCYGVEFMVKVIAVVRAAVVVQDLPNFIMSKLSDYVCFHK